MSSDILATQWIVKSRPEAQVSEENFSRQQVELPEPGDGEFLIQTIYLTVSPPMRMWLTSGGLTGVPVDIGEVMRGAGMGRVVRSRNAEFPEGTLVRGALGWTDFVISDGKTRTPVVKVNPPEKLPLSTCMHVLGASGPTAYFGLYDIGEPRIGDVVLVSAAAGSVGSIVCQLAKMSGCTVVGIAGSQQKCQWLETELGVDATINYREDDVAEAIPRLCPSGVDIYFDNVGGETLNAALASISHGARVVLCGGTSQYDTGKDWRGPDNYFQLVYREATMRGFYIFSYQPRFPEALSRLTSLLGSGDLKYAEDILEGIDKAPGALVRVLRGENFGTQLVRVSSGP